MKKYYNILLVSLFIVLVASGFAQEVRKSSRPYENAWGVLAGYHFRSGNDFVELGISRTRFIYQIFFSAAVSAEYAKLDNRNILGSTVSFWANTDFFSAGVSTTYYSNFQSSNAFSFKPMIGFGLGGFQFAYIYDIFITKPDFDFGTRNSLALRINFGIIELHKS